MTTERLLESLEETLLAALEENPELDADELIKEVRDSAILETARTYKSGTASIMRKRRRSDKTFEKRAFKRWRKAFDLFEVILNVALELGQANNDERASKATEEKDYTFLALTSLHARAILVAHEVCCLLKGGYADGALARWRSLHEVNVTALFISKHGSEIALNYLGSFAFEAERSATQYNEHAERAGMRPFSEDELVDISKHRSQVEAFTGRKIGRNHDWARPAINKDQIHFSDLEKDVDLEHWRPRYRWASQHTHAGHRPADKLLGMAESHTYGHLVGPSDAGLVDPIHMTAISLVQATNTYLLYEPNIDRLVHMQALCVLVEELGPLALRVQDETLSATKRSPT